MNKKHEKPPKPGSVLRLLWQNHPWLAFFSLVTGIVSGVAAIAVVNVVNQAIYEQGSRLHLLYWFIGLSVVALAFRNGATLFPAYANMKLMTRLRIALCQKILSSPLEEVDRRGPPNVLTLLTTDIPQLNATLLVMPVMLVEATVFMFGLAYLAYLSWTVFALTLALLVLGAMLYVFLFLGGVKFTGRVRDEFTAFNEHTHGLVFGLKELKLNGIRRRWFGRSAIKESSTRVARFNFIEHLWYLGAENMGLVTQSLLIGSLVFALPLLTLTDSQVLTASVLTVMYILGPLGLLISTMPVVAQGRIAITRLADFGFLINEHHAEQGEPETSNVLRLEHKKHWQEITLKGVVMNYRGADAESGFALGPVDLTINSGELIYIIGGNGCGKSTLVKALCGLYVPQSGQILLDGVAVTDDNRSDYRDLFSAVFSDFHLFNRLIGPEGEEVNPDLAQKYLGALGLADKIKIEGLGYSTTKELSYGQQKRLALVCAYMEDRPVYVLDEWAADQDPPFKRFFYEELLPELKRRGKTILIITHDDQYFQLADRVIKLLDGHIVSDVSLVAQDRRA
ncbi:cyclic peptide export ABC transporter [Pseudomonas chlororaphis]|uniref:cyclic peptide export ABC transporter n=1 Tax=Pseudomonas chlororaphis TaxID=587753 RepID=UPI00209B0A9C|nr:cyclic peptide export ABC transporter [Pseudomonas chlororaphis]MCO7572941.1 cyclic peptide export ABC transporter [Pseudomonas chlororaphis]MCO7591469.1 cyclic peptide export ABC transporter [Pseudomonas chlororaphis]